MIAMLALIGLGVILWWVSKGLKKFGSWLTDVTLTATDMVEVHNKKQRSNKEILQQNQKVEEHLRNIKGESSYVAYQHTVRDEIERLEKEINTH